VYRNKIFFIIQTTL